MCYLNTGYPLSPVCIFLIIVGVIWDLLWKCIAMWKSAKNDQLSWFICIAVFNTVGILPIIYLIKNQKK